MVAGGGPIGCSGPCRARRSACQTGARVILVTPALVPTDGAPQRLLARVGSGHATRTLLTGELRSPERSHQIGLMDVLMSGRGAALATTSCCPQQAPRRNVGRRWSKSGPLTGQAQEALCTSPRPDDHRTCEPSSRNRPMSSPARASARTIASLCATSPSSRSSWRRRARQPRRRRATALPRRQSPAGGQLGRVHGRPSMRWPVAAAKLCSATIGVIGRSDRGRVLLSRSGTVIAASAVDSVARAHQFRSHGSSGARDRIRGEGAVKSGAGNLLRFGHSGRQLEVVGGFGFKPPRCWLQARSSLPGQAHQRVDRHCRLARRSGVIDASDSRGYPAATPRVPSLPVDQAGASRARRPSAPRVP